ncbi:glycoside hydrolase family 113 [Botrimarina mediterranea]|uniref:Uncharacterized protein n=1 Tax=Botrimarina mediterranea TaxID=2528022 RepID=A0A518K8F8_9BACT|nr:glycosyl hydrolase family 53 [Botrimarina mediterranea]QDV74075.1 hypothetical protein Spa11_22740 [Botrimarina mediterranea]QDV78705.1 hypothetical protein K2D_23120 [Planctomycetes bacterium K2D]
MLTKCLLALATLAAALSSSVAESPLGFVKGHSWGWVGSRGDYASPAAAESMRNLAETSADTVCIAFAPNLKTYDTPRFTWGDNNSQMVSDDEVRHAIDLARENGLRVILKPTVNCEDQTWRAWIRFYRPLSEAEREAGVTGVEDPWGDTTVFREGEAIDEAAWAEWWACFGDFLEHYAKIAAEKNVDAFCLGCEMNSTESFADEWREVIRRVRAAYDGQLTYDANHGRERLVTFWDEVDFLSVSAYYPVAPPEGVTEEEAVASTTPKTEIVATLRQVRDELRDLHQEYRKPILFIETGVTNVRGCARYPWSHPDAELGSPIDEREQANYYEAMFETFWDEPWFKGFAWWDWPARLYPIDEAGGNRGFCIYGKQAEGVVRDWYGRKR